nr:putative F-box protein At1g32420 [Nicotiana tomentosiformis]
MEHSNCPDNLITDILVRLPVKSLLRFKCVHKNWYSLITSSFFVRKHLHHKENPITRLFILSYNPPPPQSMTSILLSPGVIPVLEKPVYLQIPIELDEFIGPVNGIFFMYKDLGSAGNNRMALWNPATREFRPLFSPPYFLQLSQLYEPFEVHIFGFGFDPLSDDYKVVCVSHFWEDDHKQFAAVYSLNKDCWTNLTYNFEISATNLKQSSCSTCVNGVYYWSKTRDIEFEEVLLLEYFDLHNEVFGEIPVPDICISGIVDVHLTLYKESVCLLVSHFSPDKRSIDIWLMNDEKLWIKVHNLVPSTPDYYPLGFWDHDKLILENKENVLFYDGKTRGFTHLFDTKDKYSDIWCSSNYRESLVSIKSKNVCHRQGDILDLVQEFFEDCDTSEYEDE